MPASKMARSVSSTTNNAVLMLPLPHDEKEAWPIHHTSATFTLWRRFAKNNRSRRWQLLLAGVSRKRGFSKDGIRLTVLRSRVGEFHIASDGPPEQGR